MVNLIIKMKYLKVFTIILVSLYSCNGQKDHFLSENKSLENISKTVIADLLSRDQFMMYETQGVTAIHYAEVCTAFGAARLAGILYDSITIKQLSKRYLKVVQDSITNTANHVDANVYGILPLELFKQNHDSLFFNQGIRFANDQWKNPLPNGLTNQTRFWIDDVWMIGSLQIQAYRITGDTVYLNRAAKETVAYIEKLQQPNGLFFHGQEAPFFWGRGNGWVAAGLAEVISELPENHPDYPIIAKGYKKMMHALLNYQAEDGMWRQLINENTAWKETSSTGMFGYAMCIGVKKGILPKETFQAAYQKAWLALTNYIDEDGKISNVCFGTGQSKDIHYYLERPTITGDFHGQAPILWFAYAILK